MSVFGVSEQEELLDFVPGQLLNESVRQETPRVSPSAF